MGKAIYEKKSILFQKLNTPSMQVSLVELWRDMLSDEETLPSSVFEQAAYLGIPDEDRGKIWSHMMRQREERTKSGHDSEFKVKFGKRLN